MGSTSTPASLVTELSPEQIAAMLDLGYLLVRRTRLELALGHPARQPAGGDGLAELAVEDRDESGDVSPAETCELL